MRLFGEIVEIITAEIQQHTEPLPPVLDKLPQLPKRPPSMTETFNHAGWKYRGLTPGVYHAWPDNDDFYQGILNAWHACMEAPARRMVPVFKAGLGPILTGTIIIEGDLKRAAKPATIFADAMSLPFTFKNTSLSQQFCPMLSLAAPNPVESFLKEALRCCRYNGQLMEDEYTFITQHICSEVNPPEAKLITGERTAFVGRITGAPHPVDGDGLTFWVADAYIAACDHPRFLVESGMIEREER